MNEVFLGAVDLSPYFAGRTAAIFNFFGIPKPILKDLELLTTNNLSISLYCPSLDVRRILRCSMSQPPNEKGGFFVTMYDLQSNYATFWFNP